MSDIFTAQVSAVSESGVTLILPGMTTPTQKEYRRLAISTVAAGDMVLCVRTSGTIVVLGRIA